MENQNNGEIIIYQSEDGLTHIDVKLEEETIWLTQQQLVDLYQTSKSNVSEHIKNIFEEGELDRDLVVRKFRTTASDGKSYNVYHYNLDMIISLGYRIKSSVATRFRIWATERLKDYITHLDAILSSTGEKVLENAGKVSRQQAMDKAQEEYRKFQAKTLTEVEKAYLETIKEIERETKKNKG